MPSANRYICDLSPYEPGTPVELVARQYGLQPSQIIKLASNENSLGMSPKARAAVKAAVAGIHRYPDQYALIHALAGKLGVEPACLVLGNGSNDVLDLIARTFLDNGDESVYSQYGFVVYPLATQSVGAVHVQVPAKGYGHDLTAMGAAVTPRTKVLWIANPNNPTGTFVAYAEVKRLLERVPSHVIVVLDEAYREYLPSEESVDSAAWLAEHPNLILVRTFSKIYGLAGLRIGYGLAVPEVAQLLNRVRQPFNANNLALVAAEAALGDREFVELSRTSNTEGREKLLKGLQAQDIECLPAYGNFVTARVGDGPGLYQALLQKGVVVRPLQPYGMAEWVRITVGTAAENRRLLIELAAVLGNSAARKS